MKSLLDLGIWFYPTRKEFTTSGKLVLSNTEGVHNLWETGSIQHGRSSQPLGNWFYPTRKEFTTSGKLVLSNTEGVHNL